MKNRAARRWAAILTLLAGTCAASPLAAGPPAQRPIPAAELSEAEPQVGTKIEALRRQVEEKPDSSDAWGELGMTYHAHELLSAAAACYRTAFELGPREYQWAYLAALALRKLRIREAIGLFEKAAELQPDLVAFYINFGDTLFEAGELERAKQSYHRALELDPKTTHALYGLAQVALSEGKLGAAREHLEQGTRLAPNHGEAHLLLTQVYRRLGEMERAERQAWRARVFSGPSVVYDPIRERMEAEGVTVRAVADRGRSLARRGRFAEAEQEFRRVLELGGADARHYTNLGAALTGQGKVEEALAYLRTALERSPDEAYAHQNLATALLMLGRVDEALAHARRSVEIDAGYAEGHFTLGVAWDRKGRLKDAIESYRTALEVNPALSRARNNLARALAVSDRLQDAIDEWRLGVSLEPDNLEMLFNLGTALARTGQHAEAVQVFTDGVRKAPDSSLFARALAWQLATAPAPALRDGATAVELASRVYRRYPNDPEAQDVWAAALAETGRFEEAARVAAVAAALAFAQGRTGLARQIELRKSLYEQEQAFRQPRRKGSVPEGDPRREGHRQCGMRSAECGFIADCRLRIAEDCGLRNSGISSFRNPPQSALRNHQ